MVKIHEELEKHIWPLRPEEFEILEKNILMEGIRDKIVIWKGFIVDGHNRYKISQKHNLPFETVELNFNNIEEVKDWIDANQLGRRNLTKDQFEISIGRLYNREKKNDIDSLKQNLPLAQNGQAGTTAEYIAKQYNIGRNTVRRYAKKAEEFERIEKEEPELAKSIQTGKQKLSVVLRETKRQADNEAIKQKTFPIIEGKFKTILIDPPWDYGDLSLAGRGHPEYATMGIEELHKLDIGKYTEDNCHLYLWTTNNFLHEALKLGVEWGFEYKTIITWVKPSMGMGSYFRNSTEQLLFFVKGTLQTRTNNTLTHFEAPRGEHSEKPEVSYKIIEANSYPAYLEYFGRKKREGWTVWGNLNV